MLGVFVDVENQLEEIEAEVRMLAQSLDLYRNDPDRFSVPALDWLAVQGFSSAVEKTYTGCERVMRRIVSNIDGDGPAGDDWHSSLLRRMAHPYPGIRDAVISADCFGRLDRLRAFRHRERNSYGLTLDRDIVLERAQEALPALQLFRTEISGFAARMQDPAAGNDRD